MTLQKIDDFTPSQRERILTDLSLFDFVERGVSEGGFGCIDKARIVPTGQLVAMKRIKVTDLTTYEEKRRAYESLVSEFKFMCMVPHPALQISVGLYNPDDWENVVVVTPFYENGSLDQFIRAKTLNLTHKVLIIFGVCHGLMTLHERGIAHRDLKPGNILINDKMYPVVTDFGVSRTFTDEELMTTFAGTLCYMAPDIIQHWDYDAGVDVYSFGLLVYELITGNRPYQGLSFHDMIHAKCSYSQLDISQGVPPFLADVIRQCNKPAEERPRFSNLCTQILSGYNRIRGLNVAVIDKYKQELINAETLCYSRFSIPRQIAKLPDPGEPWDGSLPVVSGELERIAEREGDNPVVFVMALGPFQTGKSTYLRALTGNAAFYPGCGESSTTKGVLLDGPYRPSDLVDRIPDDIYGRLKDRCRNISRRSDPSIYFLDSQGIGDEQSEQAHKDLFERMIALFAAVSLVCITFTKFNEPLAEMKTTLRAVRRGQLIGQGLTCSRLLVMVRGYSQEIDTEIAEYDEDVYKGVMTQFVADWTKEHKIASDHYFRGLLAPLPLGDVTNNVQNYMTTVWESLYQLLTLCDTTETGNDLTSAIDAISWGLFDDGPMEWMQMVRDYEMKEIVSDSLRHCYGCCMVLSSLIGSLIDSVRVQDVSTVMDEIIFIPNVFTKVILPYILGGDDIPSKDFYQYALEIALDIRTYVQRDQQYWEKIAKEIYKADKNRSKFFFGLGVVSCAISCLPGVGWATGPLITILGSTGRMAFWIRENKRIERIQQEGITLMYPEIWRRDMKRKGHRVLDITTLTSPPSASMCLVFYEDNESSNSQILVQSLMGISDIPATPQRDMAYYFSRMKVSDLLKRFFRTNDQEIGTRLPKVIDFMYIGYAPPESLNHLSQVLGPNTLWVTSQLGVKTSASLGLSSTVVYVFTVTEDCFENCRVISARSFVDEVNMLTSRCRSLSPADQNIYLPVYSSNLDFHGPWTNVSLRYSCRYIFGDDELHKFQVDAS